MHCSCSAALWDTAQRLASTPSAASPFASTAHPLAAPHSSSSASLCEDVVGDLGGEAQWATTERHTAAMVAQRRREWPPQRSGGGNGGGGDGAGAWRRRLFPSRPYSEQGAPLLTCSTPPLPSEVASSWVVRAARHLKRWKSLRIVTCGISGGGWLTRPFRDARRFPSTPKRVYLANRRLSPS
jgi:hypothetical protein